MNIVSLEKSVVAELVSDGRLERVLASMPNPVYLNSLILPPVERMERKGVFGECVTFIQPDLDDY